MFKQRSKDFESFEHPPHGFGHGFGGPFRAGRGMMEPAILATLEKQPMHGYEIIKTLEEKSHGMWRPSPGSIYPTLQLLEEKEFVKSSVVNGKKIYELTEGGKTAAHESYETREHMKQVFAERSHGHKGGRKEMAEIIHIIRSIHHKGTPSQHQALVAALTEFKKTLAQIKENA